MIAKGRTESMKRRHVGVIAVTVCALAAPVLVSAAPVGASTPHPKFIKDVHSHAAGTKNLSNKMLVKTGQAICSDLDSGTSFTAEAASLVKAIGNGNVISTKMMAAILKYSVIDLCPTYRPELEQFENGATSAPAPATNSGNTGSTGAPATAPTASFACSGSAPSGVDITYGSDSSNLTGGTTLPWSASLPLDSQMQYVNVTAQLQGDGSVSCTTTVNDNGQTVTKSGTASGGYQIASAEICNESQAGGGWVSC
jgi:hypothetical protein